MTKLFLIITGLNIGGAEMMMLKLLEKLSPQFSPKVISLTDIGPVGQRIQELGIPVIALHMHRSSTLLVSFFRLVKIIKDDRPDIVHTWMYHADLIGGVAAKIAQVKAIIWNIRHSDLSHKRTKFTTRLTARLCAGLSNVIPDKIQCCSATARDIHISLGYSAEKFILIPNGFDLNKFKPDCRAGQTIRSNYKILPLDPLIGMVARFDPQKNHFGFLKAAHYLHQKQSNACFLLVGKNVDYNNLELIKLINQLNLTDIVHLLGERNDIPTLLGAFDVLVLPSSYGEAFPNVLGEAMACEVPCVATDVGDSAYILGDTGRVVAPCDMLGLAEAIHSILSLSLAERQKLGYRARKRIKENFEIQHIIGLYESLYQTLIKG